MPLERLVFVTMVFVLPRLCGKTCKCRFVQQCLMRSCAPAFCPPDCICGAEKRKELPNSWTPLSRAMQRQQWPSQVCLCSVYLETGYPCPLGSTATAVKVALQGPSAAIPGMPATERAAHALPHLRTTAYCPRWERPINRARRLRHPKRAHANRLTVLVRDIAVIAAISDWAQPPRLFVMIGEGEI